MNKNLKDKAAAQSQNARKIMDMLTTKCADCGCSSSKRRLFKLEEGTVCMTCANFRGFSTVQAMHEEERYKNFLLAENNKPKPENYGEWA